MSPGVLAAVGVLGGVGAIARMLLDGAVSARLFPWGTLAVNLTGTFALGLLIGAEVGGDALRLAGTGFLGAYTTFSTWMLETHRPLEDGRWRVAAANVVVSLLAGVAMIWAGRELGAAL